MEKLLEKTRTQANNEILERLFYAFKVESYSDNKNKEYQLLKDMDEKKKKNWIILFY